MCTSMALVVLHVPANPSSMNGGVEMPSLDPEQGLCRCACSRLVSFTYSLSGCRSSSDRAASKGLCLIVYENHPTVQLSNVRCSRPTVELKLANHTQKRNQYLLVSSLLITKRIVRVLNRRTIAPVARSRLQTLITRCSDAPAVQHPLPSLRKADSRSKTMHRVYFVTHTCG